MVSEHREYIINIDLRFPLLVTGLVAAGIIGGVIGYNIGRKEGIREYRTIVNEVFLDYASILPRDSPEIFNLQGVYNRIAFEEEELKR